MMTNVLVTGGAGFIGSHLVDRLLREGHQVSVVDSLASGKLDNLQPWIGNPSFSFEKLDLLSQVRSGMLERYKVVFHLAANPDVRLGTSNPRAIFDQNIQATYNILEEMRKTDPETFIFTSSSTVYGEPEAIPTPEDYGPLRPVSMYGASKLSCESLISAYASTYGFKAAIYRLANVMGLRCTHGVVHDLVEKLQQNPQLLSMYGDGSQDKSYLHVTDCVKALTHAMQLSLRGCEIFNLGSEDRINVRRIADVVCEEMHLSNVRYDFHSGAPGGRGWPGDVLKMQLDISRLKRTGWSPGLNSELSVRRTVRELASSQPLVQVPRSR